MRIDAGKKYFAEGHCVIRGEAVTYAASTEELIFINDAGETEATAYTIAYERIDSHEKTRPVLFAFNGGPGCASTCIHLGALAPWRVKVGDAVSLNYAPPYEMEENPDTVLDICDIVLIDPVGCGYSRLLKAEAASKYYSSDGDAVEIVQIINKWLNIHKRWNSPVVIMGESYGTIRNALVADKLFYNDNTGLCSCNTIHLNGIIMLGTALDHGQVPFPVDTVVLNFTSIAASYWLHHQEGKPALKDFLEEASDFAYRKYLPALALGRRLSKEEKESVIEQLQYFTGMSREQLVRCKLRVETSSWPLTGMVNEGVCLSRYDGRFKMEALDDISSYDMFGDDAISSRVMPAFTHCFNGIWKEQLNIESDDLYDSMAIDISEKWNFKTQKAPVKCLENAMKKNPAMKVMFATGYYDMVTTIGYTEYLVSAHDLPLSRIKFETYESGHMPYLGERPAKKLGDDLHDFIKWACE